MQQPTPRSCSALEGTLRCWVGRVQAPATLEDSCQTASLFDAVILSLGPNKHENENNALNMRNFIFTTHIYTNTS